MKEMLGILGGMGPLASAEFLKTIYELNATGPEKEFPPCILYSDPRFPDRTDAILNGSGNHFVRCLIDALEKLSQLGASKLVIACITSHFFLPKIPSHLRDKVISLIDVTVEAVLSTQGRHLLLCSNGTHKAGIFQNHPLWRLAERHVIIPTADDQNRIHRLIYQIKNNTVDEQVVSRIDGLLLNYGADTFVAGCTEIHLLTRRLIAEKWKNQECRVIDPLLTLAKNIRGLIGN